MVAPVEGDLALVFQVRGEIDRHHPASTDFTVVGVAVG